MRLRLAALIVLVGLIFPVIPAQAHHSTAMYDRDHPITVTGVVKEFQWTNPHAYIILEVTDPHGKTVQWSVEMMSLTHLHSYGWNHSTVKPGDVVSCTGMPARSGDPVMLASLIKLPDGRQIKS